MSTIIEVFVKFFVLLFVAYALAFVPYITFVLLGTDVWIAGLMSLASVVQFLPWFVKKLV